MAYYGETKLMVAYLNGQQVSFIYVGEEAKETELNEEEQ